MPSPLPEVLKGLPRFEPSDAVFAFMIHEKDGPWVRLSDVVDVLRGEEGEAGHRLEIEFGADSYPTCKLVHPPTGCIPDEEGGKDGGCWLNGWIENEGIDLLKGKLSLPVTAELNGDEPLFTIDRSTPGLSGGDYAEEQSA